MSEEETTSSPEHATRKSSAKDSSEDPTVQAFSLLSKHLDSALEKQKKEIFSVLETKIPALGIADSSRTKFKFKFKGNRKQCAFHDMVTQDIAVIKAAVTSENSELALKTIDKVQKDIASRNKIVKIADKHGWDTVS